ncbi:hypothetical protein TSAR_004970 [Trichomalopsis sarcophagae]|uniref:Uncharacterized protein n=1 Tax=Trichomalopsis sarcophagae TaxID=543379 RepID=A0A232EIV9_9HYME|nr:hypothetical protein TSAR_004970 [Trichomalopsis sarcophagae]
MQVEASCFLCKEDGQKEEDYNNTERCHRGEISKTTMAQWKIFFWYFRYIPSALYHRPCFVIRKG